MSDTIPQDELDIEAEIRRLGLEAPRLNPEHIDALAKSADIEYHVFHDVQTVCSLRLPNGFTVIGSSACASPENFNEALGQKIAWMEARKRLWELEGYMLRTILDAQASDEDMHDPDEEQ